MSGPVRLRTGLGAWGSGSFRAEGVQALSRQRLNPVRASKAHQRPARPTHLIALQTTRSPTRPAQTKRTLGRTKRERVRAPSGVLTQVRVEKLPVSSSELKRERCRSVSKEPIDAPLALSEVRSLNRPTRPWGTSNLGRD